MTTATATDHRATTADLAVREAVPGDRAFILDSWLNSFRHSAFAAGIEADGTGRRVCSSAASVAKRGAIVRSGPPIEGARSVSMGITDTVFFYEQRRVCEALLRTCGARVLCPTDDPTVIVAWCCVGAADGVPILHFVYTKRDFRGRGLATHLLASSGIPPDAGCMFSHMSPPVFDATGRMGPRGRWKEEWVRRHAHWVYDPYTLIHSVAADLIDRITRERATARQETDGGAAALRPDAGAQATSLGEESHGAIEGTVEGAIEGAIEGAGDGATDGGAGGATVGPFGGPGSWATVRQG